MQQGMELAREVGADAVFACDPDADRLGVCSRTADGTFRFLTGNEIAVLTTHYKLEQLKTSRALTGATPGDQDRGHHGTAAPHY